MDQEKMNEHITKETLKRIVDNSLNYNDNVKRDIKAIIDMGKSPEEILEAVCPISQAGILVRVGLPIPIMQTCARFI